MRINTNVSSLQAQRSMREHNKHVESASGKIAQGTRVRNASDDAASLSIGTKLKTEIRSNHQAVRNANDAISEFQVAEGTLGEVGNMLTRLKELSIQAASGHLQNSDRENINLEYMSLRSEIERISASSSFQGNNLFRNTNTRSFQIGTNSDAASTMKIDQSSMIVSEYTLGIVDSSIPNVEESRINLEYLDSAIDKLAMKRAQLGSHQNRLNSTIANLDTRRLNESAAHSQTMDADLAFESSEKIRNEIKSAAAASTILQAHEFSAHALLLLK